MAENKKSFILYADLLNVVNKLPKEKAGELFVHILKYVNDMNPETDDLVINIAFEPIKLQLKRDLKKWSNKKDSYSNAGKESWKVRTLSKPQVYIIRLYSENESFIKVGITDNSVSRRFSSSNRGIKNAGYNYEILYQFFEEDVEDGNILGLELFIQNNLKQFSYMPENKFAGYTECFNEKCLNKIERCLTMFNDVQRDSTVNVTVNVNDIINKTKNKEFNYYIINENTQWKNSVYRDKITAKKIPMSYEKFENLLIEFCNTQKNNMRIPKSEPDYRTHFQNWLDIQSKKENNHDKGKPKLSVT